MQVKSNVMRSSEQYIRINMHVGIRINVLTMLLLTSFYLLAFAFSNREYVEYFNQYMPIIFIVACIYTVIIRLKHNRLFLWSPETWFYTYCAIQFGFGALPFYYGSEDLIDKLGYVYRFNDETLLKTNLLNSLSVLIVGLIFLILPKYVCFPSISECNSICSNYIKKTSILFLIISTPIVLLKHTDFSLPGFFSNIESFAMSSLVMFFFLWFTGRREMAKWALSLLLVLSLISLASFGKTIFLQNFLFAVIGIIMSRKKIKISYIVLAGFVFLLLLVWYMPISQLGRDELIYQQKLSDRLDFALTHFFSTKSQVKSQKSESDVDSLWNRQSLSAVQAFLIDQYDKGYAGDTFKDIWVYFIPRVIWPDKPITTNVARDLNYLVFGHSGSALAPSFNGDAYYNGGWILVMIVSAYIGVLFYFLSKMAVVNIGQFNFIYMPIAIMAINLGRYVEGFFASSFIGGVVIMLATWLIIKNLIPKLLRYVSTSKYKTLRRFLGA